MLKLQKPSLANGKRDGIIYGESGVGKTVISVTAPGPIIRLEFPVGEGRQPDLPISHLGIDKFVIESYSDLMTVWGALAGKVPNVDQGDPEIAGTVGFDKDVITELMKQIRAVNPVTIVIDSLGAALEGILLQHSRDFRGNKGVKNWGDLSEMAPWVLDRFLALPYNIVMTCLRERVVDEGTGRVMYQPALPGRAQSKTVFPRLDYILHLFVSKDKERMLRLQTGDDHICKLRIPPTIELPDIITANLTDVFNLVTKAQECIHND